MTFRDRHPFIARVLRALGRPVGWLWVRIFGSATPGGGDP